MDRSRGRSPQRWEAMKGLCVLVFALALIPVASASAAASYVLDEGRSLTGDCSTSPLDLVPDPGCPEGTHPPSGAFKGPSVNTDLYGDVYVANIAGEEGRIDVFDPEGIFISELPDPAGPQTMAIDSKGNLYVFERVKEQVVRYSPTVYKPKAGEIEYSQPPVVLMDNGAKSIVALQPGTALAVDPEDRLYVDYSQGVALFGSVEEENKLIDKSVLEFEEEVEGKPVVRGPRKSTSIAIDAIHRKIYITDRLANNQSAIRVFELDPPRKQLQIIDGSTVPGGKFLTGEAFTPLDVDDPSGHLFVGDLFSAKKVYELEEDGTYLATIEHSFSYVPFSEIAVDDGPFSPHLGKENYLFVSSGQTGTGHVYAFKPVVEEEPDVESVSVGNVTETEAVLHATINPGGLKTKYRLEYITQQQFEEEGETFANATVAGEGTLPKGAAEGVAVSAPATELEPGTAYRFRAFAENEKGSDEREVSFKTFQVVVPPPSCPNDLFRVGASAGLPDCRAYELVTPSVTNGLPPSGVQGGGVYFPGIEVSADGSRVSFFIQGGTLPGNEGAGGFNGDRYLASRGAGAWSSAIASPSGAEAPVPVPGGASPDQTYSFWKNQRTKAVYVRYPDGHSELVGRGSLGEDPQVDANLISENGSHIIFGTKAFTGFKLEEDAPPDGTAAVYDRSAGGATHVVSLLPGNEPQKAGEHAKYLGAPADGNGVAFEIGGTIYLRLNNAQTLEVAQSGATYAGISEGGGRVFYVKGGNLFAFDAKEGKAIPFSWSGDITPVNVASGGTRAYFVSPSVLTTEPNPNGEEAEAGKENLYLAEGEGQFRFVGIVTKRDVAGEKLATGITGGLGLWLEGIQQIAPAKDPSRTTPSGATFLFESRADLTEFESGGFAQVYRYDVTTGRLDCLSCSPTGQVPESDASLRSLFGPTDLLAPSSDVALLPNQSPDGQRAFFQSREALTVDDTDGHQDVYEWEEGGVGSCKTEGGCVYLISGGQSGSDDYLFAMSSSGDDVFFRTADLLLPSDTESTLSIYDARVYGGFAEPAKVEPCEGEACHPVIPAPALPVPGTEPDGDGNVISRKCPKGKRPIRQNGEVVRCVKRHKHKKHHRKAGKNRQGAAK